MTMPLSLWSFINNVAKFADDRMLDWLDNLKRVISNLMACGNKGSKCYCNFIKIREANVWITDVEERLCWGQLLKNHYKLICKEKH